MRKWVVRVFLLAALAGIGLWGWRAWFPGPDQAIRKRLAALARSASYAHEGEVARVYNSQVLGDFCAPDVRVEVDIPGLGQQTMSGREEVRQAALMARSRVASLSLQFVDVKVTVTPDQKSAVVNLTAKARVPEERHVLAQEFKLTFQKIGRDWLINRVESVKTLL